MAFYEEYKPFRNYMRRFNLLEGLEDVWRYSLHIVEGQPLPADYAAGEETPTFKPLGEHLHPWQLNILTRELVLNAGNGGDRRLTRWNDLAVACNHIRRLGDAAYTCGGDPPDVLFELHRIAHLQFPWQLDYGYEALMRAFKVFGDAAVDALIVRELGMTMRQFVLLGAAVGGHFRHSWGMTDQQDYSQALHIPKDASKAFFDRMSCTIQQLRTETARLQSYGTNWEYAWNPLEQTPLVRIDPAHPDRVVCPMPRYLTRRASTGVFFDLVKSSDFDNAYGPAFQAYTKFLKV